MGLWDAIRRMFGAGQVGSHMPRRPSPDWTGMGPGHAVSPEEALALLRQTGFARHAEALAELMRPAVLLIPTRVEEAGMPLGASRIGGPADLPPGMDWPRRDQGPLALIAQLRLSEIAPLDAQGLLPPRGSLLFFYDAVEQPWGMGPADATGWQVTLSEAEDTLVRTPPPDDLDGAGRFPVCALEARTVATFPSWQTLDEFGLLEWGDEQDDAEYYIEWLASITGGETAERTWLLGWPEEIQGEVHVEAESARTGREWNAPRLHEAARNLRLLLQVDSMGEAEMMWGDAGMLYFMIGAEDLAARRFERTWLTLQCY